MAALQEILFLKLGASAVLATALAAGALLRGHSAALRSRILSVAVLIVCVLPALAPMLPRPTSQAPSTGSTVAAAAASTTDLRAPVAPMSVPPRAPAPGPWLPVLIGGLWLAGAAACGVRLLRSHRAACTLVRRARPYAAAMGPGRPARVLVSADAAGAMVVGWLRPVVVLPAAALDWPAPELAAVLRHEQAHIARRDNALALIAGIVAAVQWFDPLGWLVLARLRREAEAACDDAVVRAGVQPAYYARILLERAVGVCPPPAVAAAAPFASHAAGRLRRILDQTADRTSPGGLTTFVAAGLLLLAALPATALRPATAPVPVANAHAFLRAGDTDGGPAWWREIRAELREVRAVRAWKRDPARGKPLPAAVALELPDGWTVEARDAVLLPGAKFGCVFTSEHGYVRVSRGGERFALEAVSHPPVDRTVLLLDKILTPLGYGCGGDFRAYRFVGWRSEPNLAVLRAAVAALAEAPLSSLGEVEP